MLAMDVDGDLNDAGMYYTESGDELKKFTTRDGMGIKMLQAAGFVTAFITREKTAVVERRGQKLAVPEVHQGVDDKLAVLTTLAQKYGLTLEQVAYIGDDVHDLAALRAVGFRRDSCERLAESSFICTMLLNCRIFECRRETAWKL